MRVGDVWLVMAIVLLAAQVSQAASEQACDSYANGAIAQYRTAQEIGLPTPHPVWSDDYQHHYPGVWGSRIPPFHPASSNGRRRSMRPDNKQLRLLLPGRRPAPRHRRLRRAPRASPAPPLRYPAW